VRRGQTPLTAAFGNPTVIGAITVLITILAVFLAYNANNGLPFVQSYRLTAQVPNASALVPGNEVRIGGVRVGIVESIEPVAQEDGTYAAKLAMKLDKSVEPLPVDSTLVIRSRSALGLKYVQIVRGTSDNGYSPGATLPLSAARPEPVEYDQLLSMFDRPTQQNIRENLTEFGNALAGRGPNLNTAIGALKPLMPRLERVMRNISDPRSGIGPFFTALEQSASEVAPVAQTQAQMFVDLDTTLAAFADVARPYLQETITKTPVTLRTASDTLPRIRPFLNNSRKLFVDLRPGSAAAAASADTIAAALRAGIPVLRASPQLNDQLPPTAAALRRFNDNGDVREGIGRLIDLSGALTPPLRFIAPAQSVCNYLTLLLRNGADATSQGNQRGNWQRANAVGSPTGPNSEGSPSSGPANGGGGSSDPQNLNYLHVNPYPNTASPGQSPTECEAGNENYIVGKQVIGNVPGDQGIKTEDQIGFQLRKGGGG
jgi:phospholipid/cholesterol/gamma-HCH transport system substrate-binding protein